MSAEPQVALSDVRRESGGFSSRPTLPPKNSHVLSASFAGGRAADTAERTDATENTTETSSPEVHTDPESVAAPHLNGNANVAAANADDHLQQPEAGHTETAESGAETASESVAAVEADATAADSSTPTGAHGDDSTVVPGLPQEASESDGSAVGEGEIPNLEDALADYSETRIRPGDTREGRIVSIDGDTVIVDFGAKIEGMLPLAELHEAGRLDPQPGEPIEVMVERLGAPGDFATLSHLKIHRSRVWDQIETAYREKATLTAKAIGRVKGGLTVDVGLPAFLPGSQADVRPVADLDALVGEEISVRIVKLSRTRGNIVVSSRALLEEELLERRREALAKLSEGATVTGTIKNITSYGAFVDLGGLDGLLHVTDISWGRVRNPAEVLQVGQEITLKVSKFEPEQERVSLSLKHLQPDPWENIDQRYREGERVTGRVVTTTDYGAFIELDPGLEGLIHVSELSWSKRLKHPSKVLKTDQVVGALVTQVDTAQRRISLSVKQLLPDPWLSLGDRYPIGQTVEARVRNLTSYGAFVELEEGVDGLVHVSDLSWSSQVKHPKDVLRKGQRIKAVVLHVDAENRRISLGIKQLEPDVWEKYFSEHLEGDDVAGRVTRLAKFGAFVELAPGVEGLCHNSEMSTNGPRKNPLRIGQDCEFRIVKLDEFDKKISLSRRAFELAHCEERPAAVEQPVAAPAEDGPREAETATVASESS